MRNILPILIIFYSSFGYSQDFNIGRHKEIDSLIVNKDDFHKLLPDIKKIESKFAVNDSITYTIDTTEGWFFLYSYKTGWEEVVGPRGNDSLGIRVHRREFNDIRISRSSTSYFTANELKELFYLNKSQFYKDSIGKIIRGPARMTKDKKYLVIGKGHCYPVGNQSSWCYRNDFYFKRREH